MNPKKLRQLKKATKKARTTAPAPYIAQLTRYRDLFDKVPQVKYLLNAALLDDQLLKSGLLPQPLPKLLLPDDIQTVIFNQLAAKYPRATQPATACGTSTRPPCPRLTPSCATTVTT